jgi:hypothetical protein
MKALFKIALVVYVAVLLTSCSNYLDINTNPNQAISSTPRLLTSSSLAGTASVLEGYNVYGAETGGYAANAGGYGGFNELFTYQYTNNTFTGLWSSTYSNLENYQQIINIAKKDANQKYINYEAIAMIMQAHDYQLLVDQYNDVPYTASLAGLANLTPTYDKGSDVYPLLAKKLDSAIAKINLAPTLVPAPVNVSSEDIVFGGTMSKWLQFANTLKLKLMIRANGKVTFANTTFDPAGFLAADVLINPGFRNDNGRQNPKWGNWAWDYAGNAINKAWMPSIYVLSFYNGIKLLDSTRGRLTYYNYSQGTPKISNQLGYENVSVPSCPDGTFWYPGTNRSTTSAGASTGALKGPDAGYPLFTAAESYFLQAEAKVRGISIPVAATDGQLFYSGMAAAFTYSNSRNDRSQLGMHHFNPNIGSSGKLFEWTIDSAVVYYQNANKTSYLANYSLAATQDQQIEAIITQKYIALNFVHSHEGWNEFRRTGYPISTGSSANTSFASIKSQATRGDKLPTRLLYPVSEARYNPNNVPQNISPLTSLIFWAK